MMKKRRFLISVGAIVFFLFAACGQFSSDSVPTVAVPTQTRVLTNTPPPTRTAVLPTITATLSPALASVRIAFTYEEKLWLWQNGTSQPLTNVNEGASVNISDDGNFIAFTRDGLWVINSDGSNERLLLGDEDFKEIEPKDPGVELDDFDWIPNTHRLLFNTILSDVRGMSPSDDLYSVDAETMEWKLLRKPGEGGRFFISPDGQKVAMTTPDEIRLMNIDGSNYHVVMDYSVPFPSDYAYYAAPDWATDSQSLTVPIPPEDFYYTVTTSPTLVWRLPVDGTAPTIISQLPPGDSGYDKRIWSPEKEHFAFWFEGAYHVDTDGTILNPITEIGTSELGFAWIDETHFIYYLSHCDLRLGTIGAPSVSLTNVQTNEPYCSSNYDYAK